MLQCGVSGAGEDSDNAAANELDRANQRPSRGAEHLFGDTSVLLLERHAARGLCGVDPSIVTLPAPSFLYKHSKAIG